MNNINYEVIKDSVVFSFEEYMEEDGYNSSQAAARILEEDWRALNYSLFSKACYYILIAIESFKTKEIADFIFERLNEYLEISEFNEEINENDIQQLKEDIIICKKLLKEKKYNVVETSYSTKSRIDYILSLKSDF
ncbi:hypothetical protein FDB15_14190 [Clostridium botulinum]|uniref:hypothetical protein n=1 Tax=unclassified Clostridium TaxID=2614128 RepID=UPI0004FFFA76|nr:MULTISPECIES: hypothetical protein [unclassified Clostridium]AIY78758.1 hypothetical protein U728_1565 [Clostridium botulinum 202F]KAI3344905.1 hypothetical protein CIT17_14905 [Clostridium botulinum]KFX53798.1 hypothetical protein KU40_17685 [Clostridium botulinum]KON13962.1 hypothetical protein ACP50_07855 [Clostridium botulinum]MBN1053747.1 hypothetical protein [Clostridium botulinum]